MSPEISIAKQMQALGGKPVYLNPYMEIAVESKATVNRTWLDRLLSLTPWVKTKQVTVVVMEPMRNVVDTGKALIMHPKMYEELKQAIGNLK